MTKAKARILIVEDEQSINEAYKMILEKSGFDVMSVFDGEEALAVFDEYKPHVVLLDLRMPKLDGVGVLKKLSEAQKKSTEILVLSNYDMQKEVEEAYKLGAKRYILKALASPKELVALVNSSLK